MDMSLGKTYIYLFYITISVSVNRAVEKSNEPAGWCRWSHVLYRCDESVSIWIGALFVLWAAFENIFQIHVKMHLLFDTSSKYVTLFPSVHRDS